MVRKVLILFVSLAVFFSGGYSQSLKKHVVFSGIVRDAVTKEMLSYAVLHIAGQKEYSAVAGENGDFKIPDVLPGDYVLTVSYLGYDKYRKSLSLNESSYLTINLFPDNQLREVVITATGSKGLATASRIDREAMAHLQPNSFTDLLELLPGGISKDPAMGSANLITLRETGNLDAYGTATTNSNYTVSSLGTLFVIDGAPVSTDANLQYIPYDDGSLVGKLNTTNSGVDMRSIPTDNIETVEIVRGIPSVEYGNLTSGMVDIRRIRKATRFTARFKADGYSKLVSAGKGFAVKNKDLLVNVDGGFLDAKDDPRNNLQNYKRMNASLRLTWNWKRDNWALRWTPDFDYTGSFDNAKQDPDLNYGAIDKYKSTYNKVSFTNNYQWTFPKIDFINSFDVNSSVNMQFDKLERTKLVSPTRYGLAPTGMEAGDHDARLLFSEYIANYLVDGKPVNGFVKIKGDFGFKPFGIDNNIKAGGEWNISKNLGRGQVYDLSRPIGLGAWSSRPRAYKDIPDLQNLSFFLEDNITARIGGNKLEIMAGVRTVSLVGLDKAYLLHGKVYFDPRLNAQWNFPAMYFGSKKFEISLAGGIGQTTRMPTINYLFPDKYYTDIIQLGYYDTGHPEEYSRFNVRTYVNNVTNYNLKPAHNKKWELRLNFNYDENRLSVGYFRENMISGFRYSAVYKPYIYKDYDESSIVGSQLAGPPALEDIPYVEKKKLDGYRIPENGSKLEKEGVEFEFSSRRIRILRTAVNLNGAWFRSVYTNSLPMFKTVNNVVDDVIVSDNYVGLYDWNDGKINHQFSSNLMLDTQVPEWGLIFSTSFQSMWFIKTQRLYRDGRPVSYLDVNDGLLHPYTDASASDLYLQHLMQYLNDDVFREFRVPVAFYVNFKATKRIGKYLDLALFVNRLLDYTPDFTSNGYTVRRNVSPYFGMELNFKL